MLHGRLTGNKVVNWDIKVGRNMQLMLSFICSVLTGIIQLVLHGFFNNALLYYLWQDMINCVGGLPVLFPLLEQLALVTPDQHGSDPSTGSDFITPDVTTPADGDWVILPSNRASGLFLPQHAIIYFLFSLFLLPLASRRHVGKKEF